MLELACLSCLSGKLALVRFPFKEKVVLHGYFKSGTVCFWTKCGFGLLGPSEVFGCLSLLFDIVF
jgi:hypothetical protein